MPENQIAFQSGDFVGVSVLVQSLCATDHESSVGVAGRRDYRNTLYYSKNVLGAWDIVRQYTGLCSFLSLDEHLPYFTARIGKYNKGHYVCMSYISLFHPITYFSS